MKFGGAQPTKTTTPLRRPAARFFYWLLATDYWLLFSGTLRHHFQKNPVFSRQFFRLQVSRLC
jgi:hypothetical protein